MNFSIIRYILGWILNFQAAFMLLPGLVALLYQEKQGFAFLIVALVLLAIGVPLVIKKPKNSNLRAREGFVTVAFAWIVMSLTGAIPYVITKSVPSFVDALFETVSGYTTTGASILVDGGSLCHCLDFWHCFTVWIGGMGILVFMMAVVPLAGGESIHIMRAESPGPVVGKLLPKMRDSAMVLYIIYIVLTIVEIVTLLISGLPFFDSLCLSLSNAGTGGFGVLSTGTIGYTATQQIILTVFMILFSINFNMYFLLLVGKPKEIFKNEELRTFLIIVALSSLAITFNIIKIYGSFGESFRHAIFQVATVMSTTGFASTDFNLWPAFSKGLLVMLMFVGACAGSTCGGMKISRIIILVKNYFKELVSFTHPNNVRVLKIDGKKVEQETVKNVNTYLVAFIIIFIASFLLLAIAGNLSLEENFSAIAACLNNIGPGLGILGPTGNYSSLTVLQKIVLTADMLIGRLELFPIMILVLPSTWRKK